MYVVKELAERILIRKNPSERPQVAKPQRKPMLSALLWSGYGGMCPSSVYVLETMFSPTW